MPQRYKRRGRIVKGGCTSIGSWSQRYRGYGGTRGATRGRNPFLRFPPRVRNYNTRSSTARGRLRARRGRLFPLLALIPAAIAAAKIAAGGALAGAAGYGTKKILEKVTGK